MCLLHRAGWTSIRHDAVNSGNKATSWLYYKIAGANEPASYGWNISSNWAAGVMGAWRGAAGSPVDNASGATAAGASPISVSAPSLTPNNDSELQVYFYGSQSAAAPTIALSKALTQRFNVRSSKEGFTLGLRRSCCAVRSTMRHRLLIPQTRLSLAGAVMTGAGNFAHAGTAKRDSDTDRHDRAHYDRDSQRRATATRDGGANHTDRRPQLRPDCHRDPADRRHFEHHLRGAGH